MAKVLMNVRVEPALREAAKAEAKKDGRTLTNWIEKLIRDKLAKEKKR